MKKRSYILSMALMLLMQTSCIYDNNSVEPCGSGDAELLVINFNLTVPSSSTRTRNECKDLLPGSKDESYIDINNKDYQILMFDNSGALVEGKLSEFECIGNGVNGNGEASYILTAHLELDGKEDKELLSKFSVMVLANWKSFEKSNANTSFEYPSFIGYTTNNIYTDKENPKFHFTLKEQGQDEYAWVPSSENGKNQFIPMFGVAEDLDLQFVMDMARYGDDPCFNVPMLRSMAKIEIVDMVPDGKSANFDKCSLTKYNRSGRVIPDITKNTSWNVSNTQITTPSLPDNVNSSENLKFFKTTKTVRTERATEDEIKDCFVAYIPEMALALGSTDRPELKVKLKGSDKEYPIKLSGYKNGKPDDEAEYTSLLRNHIYRFNVTSVDISADLTLFIDTPEWDVDDDQEWSYEDAAVGFTEGGKFDWINPNYETILDDTDRILLVGYDSADAAYGHFQFKPTAANNHCTWTLSLIADDATKNDYFTIQIKNGDEWENCGDTVTRDLDDNMVDFRIMATGANGSTTDYSARVIMTVQTFDGRVAVLNLTGTTLYDSSNDKFYYVVKQLTNGGDNM